MSICAIPVVGAACTVVDHAAKSAFTGVLGSLAKAAVDAEAEVLKTLTTAFLSIPTPDLSSSGSAVAFLQGSLQWLVVFVATISLVFAAGRLAWSRRIHPATQAGGGIVRLIVISGAGVAVVTLGTTAGDAFSTWILNRAVTDPTTSITAMATLTAGAFTSPFLVFILAGVATLGILVNVVLLVIRSALLVVLTSLWPLSAAAALTPAGSSWHKKITGYLLACLLFKPVAAVLFAVALRLTTASTTPIAQIEGVTLLLLSTLALPVLMKLAVPMVAAAGGLGTAEVAGAGAGLAMGAIAVAGSGGALAAAGASTHSPGLVSRGGGSPDGAVNTGSQPPSAPPASSGGGGAKGAAQAAQSLFSGAHETVRRVTGEHHEGTSA